MILSFILLGFGTALGQSSATQKFVKNFYKGKTVSFKKMTLDATQKSGLGEVWAISASGQSLGYVAVKSVYVRTTTSAVAVIFAKDKTVKATKIVDYNEPYALEVKSARWAQQFEGKANGSKMIFNRDIRNISGATISCKAISNAIKQMSKTITSV